MKKFLIASLLIVSAFFCASCSTTVKRVAAEDVKDLSGYWNDIDVQTVCSKIINECLSSPFFTKFKVSNSRNPLIKVGQFRNQSSEHIDTSIITTKFRNAVINSGQADFVASKEDVQELREERLDQQDWASWETAKKLAEESAADFMLQGSVKTIIQQNRNKSYRTYYVYAELVDIESGKIVWVGENEDIKKFVKNPGIRF
ncbi:MAG: penicillin-binding protein activator LpoB [Sphaerochaetaceae bacterium]|nr:penicillin-binding protein activator LpoB [Sphaerochaetaceae bacterium]